MVYEVSIENGADANKYWGSLAFHDRHGRLHERQIGTARKATKNSNFLQALIDAVKELQVACNVTVYCNSEYIVEPFRKDWIEDWKKNDWTKSKGKPLKNDKQWKETYELLEKHTVKFEYTDGRSNDDQERRY